jgi:DNA-directed RNA polymerase subunit RPC12/RpoP
MDLESLGKMAQLPDDISPLKIGSQGKFKNTRFEVIGRLKIAWSEGYWNEWFLLFEDGKQGWLAEAMGFFMLSFEVSETTTVPAKKAIALGKIYELVPSRRFFVDDIKDAVCMGSEGELPFRGLQGRKTLSVDLSDNSGQFASIEYSDQDGIDLYIGMYVEFDSLEWSNLRDLAADIKKIRGTELFKCPSCGGPFSLLTPGITASAACKYCGSVIDTTNKNLAILSKADRQMKVKPLIPIGNRGILFGTSWEVTGFMTRTDDTGQYPWDEYLLFDPHKGFRWLTTYKGHWNYVEMLRDRALRDHDGAVLKFDGKNFKKFLVGKGKVAYVLGEFYWRTRVGETVELADYICPPEILSGEWAETEANWSLGTYMEPEQVAAAFGITEEMPAKEGVAPNQPNPYRGKSRGMTIAFWAFVCFLTVLQVYFIFTSHDKEVFREQFTFNSSEKNKSITTTSFDLPGGSGNLSADLHANVQNDWMEAVVSLIDEKTNKNIGFSQNAEHYSGVDDGESWSEGSPDAHYILSSVPGGRYHMVVQPTADSTRAGEKTFTLSLRRGVVAWSNFIVALLLLCIYPICGWCRSRGFEAKRWSESDLTPAGRGEADAAGTDNDEGA